MPSSALLRLSTVDTNAVLREAHVLFTEAYWSRESFAPAWSELRYWLTTAIPIGVWARMERLFVTRLAEIGNFAKGALETRDGFELFRVMVSIAVWPFQAVTLPTAYILGAVAAQVLLAIASLVRLVPIPWLQRGIRAVIATLMGTLGQSFALQNSPIRRAAIVSAVTKNLNWLGDRCRRVVVLSHSQGAEVARRVFLDARKDEVASWYTFGAGIAPLNMLHPRILEKPAVKVVVFANKLVLVLVGTLLISLALDTIPGVRLGTQDLLAQAFRETSWLGIALAYAVFIGVVATLAWFVRPPVHKMNLRKSLLAKWSDIFASEDPVPGGSFIDRYKKELGAFKVQQHRVFNTRVSVFDHTSYWQNIEEFVAPIAMDLLHLLGIGGHYAQEKAALRRASRRRDLRTWWNMMVWVPALAACVVVGLRVAFGPAHRGAVWAELARGAWSQGSGVLKRLDLLWNGGFFGQVITDLWLPFVILIALAVWSSVMMWMGHRSERALIEDLAAAARSPVSP